MSWETQNKREYDWIWLWGFFFFLIFFFPKKQHACSAQLVEMNSEWKTSALCWAGANASASQQTALAWGLCCAYCSSAAPGFQLMYLCSFWTVGRTHCLNTFFLAKWKGHSWEDECWSFCLFLVIAGAFRSQLVQPELLFETLGIQHDSSCPCLSLSSNGDVNDTGA